MIAATPTQPGFRRSCASPSFIALKAARVSLVRILLAVYLAAYLGLSLLCGFGRGLAGAKVLGPLNLGYALIIGNYLLACVLGVIYLHRANNHHDALAAAALADHAAGSTAVTSRAA